VIAVVDLSCGKTKLIEDTEENRALCMRVSEEYNTPDDLESPIKAGSKEAKRLWPNSTKLDNKLRLRKEVKTITDCTCVFIYHSSW